MLSNVLRCKTSKFLNYKVYESFTNSEKNGRKDQTEHVFFALMLKRIFYYFR